MLHNIPRLIFVATAIALTVANVTEAQKYSNKYIEFELPEGFICRVEETENVCQSRNPAQTKDAVIVFAAKIQGPDDSLGAYENHLAQARLIKDVAGRPVEVRNVYPPKVRKVNDHEWVDALQMNGEIPDYYTRYMTTVKSGLGVLFTYSVQKDKFREFNVEFLKTVNSLRVFRKSGPIPGLAGAEGSLLPPLGGGMAGAEGGGGGLPTLAPNAQRGPQPGASKGGMDPKTQEILFYVITALVAGLIIFLYKKFRSKS